LQLPADAFAQPTLVAHPEKCCSFGVYEVTAKTAVGLRGGPSIASNFGAGRVESGLRPRQAIVDCATEPVGYDDGGRVNCQQLLQSVAGSERRHVSGEGLFVCQACRVVADTEPTHQGCQCHALHDE